MKQWIAIYNKEMLENWRNYKIVWIPLVFILLGIMQPMSIYYLPQILETFGGLPEGAILEMPLPSGGEVMASLISQYNSIGILILVLAFMGIISGERERGVLSLIMVKPVSYISYIFAKWAGAFTIMLLSLFLGFISAWYYTNILIEKVEFSIILSSMMTYGLWLTLAITITILLSIVLKGSGGIAFLAILSMLGISVLTSLFSKYTSWSPGNLSNHANQILLSGQLGEHYLLVIVSTMIVIIGILLVGIKIFKEKELPE